MSSCSQHYMDGYLKIVEVLYEGIDNDLKTYKMLAFPHGLSAGPLLIAEFQRKSDAEHVLLAIREFRQARGIQEEAKP